MSGARIATVLELALVNRRVRLFEKTEARTDVAKHDCASSLPFATSQSRLPSYPRSRRLARWSQMTLICSIVRRVRSSWFSGSRPKGFCLSASVNSPATTRGDCTGQVHDLPARPCALRRPFAWSNPASRSGASERASRLPWIAGSLSDLRRSESSSSSADARVAVHLMFKCAARDLPSTPAM